MPGRLPDRGYESIAGGGCAGSPPSPRGARTVSSRTHARAASAGAPDRRSAWSNRSSGHLANSGLAACILSEIGSLRQPLVPARRKASGGAGGAVEGWLRRAGEIAVHTVVEDGLGVEAAFMAQPLEPAHANRDMADLVSVDPLENGGAAVIARAFQASNHLGGHAEPARFEYQRHHRQPRQQIVRGDRSRLPQPVMRRQIAVGGAEPREAFG